MSGIGNQTKSIFGQSNNQGNSLFGQSNNQGNSLFGQSTNQGNSLFGQSTNQGNNLFGQSTNQGNNLFGQSTNQGNSLFGQSNNQGNNLFGQSNNQGNSLFGQSNNQKNNIFGQSNNQGNSLFGQSNNNQGNNLFGQSNNQQNNIFGNNINQNNRNQENYKFYTTETPVIVLSQNNELKNIQLNKLPENFQNSVLELKLNLKKQEIKLDELERYSQRLINLIDQNTKSVEKFREFNYFINQKLIKYDQIIKQVKDNYSSISESFEEEQRNIKLMEQDAGYKIEIPSKFLLNYSQNLLNRTELFQKRLNDTITLIKLYYSQSNNDYNFDSDIMESTIAEFVKIVKCLLESTARQEKMINEMLHVLLKAASDKGYNPNTVYNNIKQYTIECNSNSS